MGTTTQLQIYHNFDQQPLFNMYEDFIVKYEGYITSPCTCPIEFMAQADDGTKLYLDGQLITNDWRDKGGGGSVSQPVQFQAGVSKQILLWFYENGGGAWVQLWWMVENQWEIVPATAFTQQPFIPSTTTTELPTTTTIETSTTTTTEETTTTTSSTTVVPSTTSQPPTTTTSSSTTSEPVRMTTTSSTAVNTTTTSTQPSLPPVASTVPSPTTSASTSTSTTSTSTTVSSTTTLPPNPEDNPLQNLEPEKVAEAVVSQIEDATEEELETFFEELNMASLTSEQQDAVAEALSSASDDVKKVFEETVNIFGEGFDNYTPVGSSVTVAERKVIIAATGVLFMAPTVSVSSSTSGSQSSDSRRRR